MVGGAYSGRQRSGKGTKFPSILKARRGAGGGGSGRGCATRREALHTSLGPESHLLGYQRCSHVVLCDATRVGLGE